MKKYDLHIHSQFSDGDCSVEEIVSKVRECGIDIFSITDHDNTIIESIKKTKNVITIEDGTIINGLATAVKELIVNNNLQGVKIKSYAYPDEFIKHGSVDELEKIYGLDEENIINGVNKS